MQNDWKPYVFFVCSVALFSVSFLASANTPAAFSNLEPYRLIEATNRVRLSYGLPALEAHPALMAAAEDKARDMAIFGYFAHKSPQGIQPWYWFKKNDYHYTYAGENLAINYRDTDSLIADWLESQSHKANLMSPRYRDVGVAIVTTVIDGRSYTFIAELFGTADTFSLR